MFKKAPFVRCLGMELVSCEGGRAESVLRLRAELLQQHGSAHAGVQATLADHTAGAAATSLLGEKEHVVSVEFKINFLRPAYADVLVCRSEVLRRGRTLVIAESAVFSRQGVGEEKLTAKAIVTLAVTDRALT